MVKSISEYDVSEDVFNLRDFLDSALATLVSVYESYNVPLPTRRYWTTAEPAEDCEQAVVSFIQLYLGAPGDQANSPQNCRVAPRSAVLEITVTRNYPVGVNGKPIPTSDLIKASEWSAVDTWILMQSAVEFDSWKMGVIATVTVNKPSGGVQTTLLSITVAVP